MFLVILEGDSNFRILTAFSVILKSKFGVLNYFMTYIDTGMRHLST